jgi:hypothetical protein
MRQAQGVVEDLLVRLGSGGFADVVDLAVIAAQHDGDPLLAGQLGTQALPAQVNPLGLERNAQGVDQVLGQHRDEQMAVDPLAFVMVDGAQARVFNFRALGQ